MADGGLVEPPQPTMLCLLLGLLGAAACAWMRNAHMHGIEFTAHHCLTPLEACAQPQTTQPHAACPSSSPRGTPAAAAAMVRPRAKARQQGSSKKRKQRDEFFDEDQEEFFHTASGDEAPGSESETDAEAEETAEEKRLRLGECRLAAALPPRTAAACCAKCLPLAGHSHRVHTHPLPPPQTAKSYLDQVKAIERAEREPESEDDEEGGDGVGGAGAAASHGAVADRLRLDALEGAGHLQRRLAHRIVLPPLPRVGDWGGPSAGGGRVLRGHRLAVTAVALTPDDRTVFSVSKDGAILQYDVETGARQKFAAAAAAGAEQTGTVADWVKRGPRQSGHASLLAAAVSSDGRYLAVGGGDKKVHIWDARSRQYVRVCERFPRVVAACVCVWGCLVWGGGVLMEADQQPISASSSKPLQPATNNCTSNNSPQLSLACFYLASLTSCRASPGTRMP